MKKVVIVILILSSFQSIAQEVITLNQAIEIALKSNYEILMVSNAAETATILNKPGEAGIYPSARAGVADQYSTNNIFQKFANGQEISSPNAAGNNFAAFVALDWTLFSGFRLAAQRDRLAILEGQGKTSLKSQIARTVELVTATYLDIARLDRQLINSKEIIGFNEARLEIAQLRFDAGLSSKSDLLQAQVDINLIKQQLQRFETQRQWACLQLNTLLARDINLKFNVEENIDFVDSDPTALRSDVLSKNYDLVIIRSEKLLAENQLKQIESQQYPTVNFTGAYDFTRTDNSAGFSLFNRSFGPTAGLNISVPLYAGGTLKRQKVVTALQVKTADLMLKSAEQTVLAEFEKAYLQYQAATSMLVLQESSRAVAEENLTIISGRLQQGQANTLEVRQAQVSYEAVLTELSNIRYEKQIAQTRMLLLAGRL